MSWIGALGWFFFLICLGLFLWSEYDKDKIQREAIKYFLELEIIKRYHQNDQERTGRISEETE